MSVFSAQVLLVRHVYLLNITKLLLQERFPPHAVIAANERDREERKKERDHIPKEWPRDRERGFLRDDREREERPKDRRDRNRYERENEREKDHDRHRDRDRKFRDRSPRSPHRDRGRHSSRDRDHRHRRDRHERF